TVHLASVLERRLTGGDNQAETSLAAQERALVAARCVSTCTKEVALFNSTISSSTSSHLFKQASGFNMLGWFVSGDIHIHHDNVPASPLEVSPILDAHTAAGFTDPALPQTDAYGQTIAWNQHPDGYATTYEPIAEASGSQSFSRPRTSEIRNHPNLFTTASLVAHWVATDDEHFKEVMLGAYPDFLPVRPEEQLFDMIKKQFEQAVAKPYPERHKYNRPCHRFRSS
ncbi:hypothetical protein C8F04DRAFT_1156444, partial [Mycena alexandri]